MTISTEQAFGIIQRQTNRLNLAREILGARSASKASLSVAEKGMLDGLIASLLFKCDGKLMAVSESAPEDEC
ncbi:MAG: hypothetical protein EOO38_00860 [Cytophagaceae bacterium]|nr:MAG: hypothetical protein EOO38_00860 [Cytophagaceae bacterium]